MSKINIKPIELPLGLGSVDRIEIRVNYAIGDESTTLEVHYYNGSFEVTQITPKLIPVPPSTMESWGYDFGQIVTWAMTQIGAEFPEP